MDECQEFCEFKEDKDTIVELPESGTVTVVGVRFRPAGKVYFFKVGEEELKVDDQVIVQTIRGIEAGTVVIGQRELPVEEIVALLSEVIS